MYTFILQMCCCPPIYIFMAFDKNHDLYVDSKCLDMFNVLFCFVLGFFAGEGLNILPLNKNVDVKTRSLQLTCVLF